MDPNHPIAYFHPNKKNLAFHKIATLSTVAIGICLSFRLRAMEKIQTLHHHHQHTNMECREVQHKYIPIHVGGVRKVPIIQTISATTFPSLTSLILSNNHIESIEGIDRLITPGLLVLKLSTLWLTQMKIDWFQLMSSLRPIFHP